MSDYSDLIKALLPDDLTPEDILEIVSEDISRANPAAAWEYALSNHPRINWDAYLARNPDVEAAGIDPCLHFLNDGVYEGRRLVSWHPFKQKALENGPLVSVIIAIYNNRLYLRKCLESALNQTLRDIEVIAVNDASTDDSLAIIESLAKEDPRLRIINKQANGGIFMARKSGVLAARGRYLMFSDGDDFLTPDACEIGYREIRKGYDIVQGGANIVTVTKENPERAAQCARSMNGGEIREYKGGEILEEMYIKRSLIWPLWSKIMLRELAVAGYNDLKDGYYVGAEDVYAMASIAAKARNLLRIDAKFYNYIFGTGISTLKRVNKAYRLWFNHGETIKALGEYAKERSLNIGFRDLAGMLCNAAISKWATDVPEHEAGQYFNIIKNQYGLEYVLDILIDQYSHRMEKIAAKFCQCPAPAAKKIDFIGVVVKLNLLEEARHILAGLAAIKRCKRIIVYLEGGQGEKWTLPEGIEALTFEAANKKDRAFALARAVEQTRPDVVIYIDCQSQELFFDLVIFGHYGIPCLAVYLGDFCLPFLDKRAGYPHSWHELALRRTNAVICFSLATELYLRLQGVTAWALPLPKAEIGKTGDKPQYDLAFIISAFTTDKEVQDCIHICRTIAQNFPWLSALAIDRGADEKLKGSLRSAIAEAGLGQNITLTGTDCDVLDNISRARIFVSTKAWDGIGQDCALARTAGLLCVIFDLPLEQSGIIKVAQGDIKAAADIISDLLNNGSSLDALTTLLKKQAGCPGKEEFAASLANVMDNFQLLTPIHEYEQLEYEKVVKYAAKSFCQNEMGERPVIS